MLKKIPLAVAMFFLALFSAQAASYPDSGELSLQAGPYLLRVAAQRAYTISAFDYQSFPLLAKGGANGTIFGLPNGSMLGSSNRSGGLAEQVDKLSLQVDGVEKTIQAASFSGKDITLFKESLIGGLRFFTTLNLNADGLTCKLRFNYEKEQEIRYFYLFVLGWRTDMNEFLQARNDKIAQGEFKSDGEWLFNSQLDWFALYQQQRGFGAVSAFSKNIPLIQRRISVWDHKAYKKNYVFHKIPDFQKEKESAEYVVNIAAFQAAPETWQAIAKTTAEKQQSKLSAAATPTTAEEVKTRRLNPYTPPDYGDISNEDWQSNRRGIEALHGDYVLPPFTPIQATEDAIEVWNRTYKLAASGLLEKAIIAGDDFFARPMSMSISANGEQIHFQEGEAKLLERWQGRAVYERKSHSANLDLSAKTTVEYDGMVRVDLTLSPKQKITLDHFDYAFHLPHKNARFLHFVGCPEQNSLSIMIPRESFSFSVPEKTGVFFEEPFKTLVWLGNNDKGFLWFSESEQHFSPQESSQRPAALRAINSEAEVTFQVSPVTAAYSIEQPITYTFGFFATPVRPMPEKWRSWFFTTRRANYGSEAGHGYVGNMPMIWPDEFGGASYPRLSLKNRAKVEKLIAELHQQGRPALTYCDPIRVRIGNLKYLDDPPRGQQLNDLYLASASPEEDAFIYRIPELAVNMKEWQTQPELIYAYGAKSGGREVRVSSASGWADFFCFLLEKWAKIGFDGFGDIDNCFPIKDQNPLHGAGYIDQHGQRRWQWDWFARRDLMKRVAATFIKARNGKPAFLVAHASATWSIPFISFCDANLTFEHSNSGYFSSTRFLSKYNSNNEQISNDLKNGGKNFLRWTFPKERWQAELSGHQFGLPAVIMSNLTKSPHVDKDYSSSVKAARELGAFVIAHDAILWPIWCNTAPLVELIKIREKFGTGEADVIFHPYWQPDNPVKSSSDEISVTAYQRPGKFLLNICNLGEKTVVANLDLSALGAEQVQDCESGEFIKLNGGRCEVSIPERDYLIYEGKTR